MTKLLQDKEDQWRDRPNGATPVFDPGLSPMGTDAEAGGARAPASDESRAAHSPMPTTPKLPKNDPRLQPWFWWTIAGLALASVIGLGLISLA